MVLAGVAMLLLALAAIGMVLATAGLDDKRDDRDGYRTGYGEAGRVLAAEEDRRERSGRVMAVR